MQNPRDYAWQTLLFTDLYTPKQLRKLLFDKGCLYIGKPLSDLSIAETAQLQYLLVSGSANYIEYVPGSCWAYMSGTFIYKEEINGKFPNIVEVKCKFCDYINRIDYSRLPAIVVLKCGNCGGTLE